ncbi:MAG: hypothetical protein AB1640_23625 [bacterium]
MVEPQANQVTSSVSLPRRIAALSLPEKIRLALTGDRESRAILYRESNKLLLGYLLQNPRVTDHEVLQMAKDKTLPEEILLSLSKRKEWIKQYPVRLALAQNPKLPLPNALKLLATLRDADLRKIARSKDVSVHIAGRARKLLAVRGLL